MIQMLKGIAAVVAIFSWAGLGVCAGYWWPRQSTEYESALERQCHQLGDELAGVYVEAQKRARAHRIEAIRKAEKAK